MAKNSVNIDAQCAKILSDVREGRFRPLYLLMGDEPYYPELVCDAILKYCIPEEEKDFNETVCYGGEVTAAQVVTAARRFPMMAERQLVVVKEAQQMKGIEELAFYCAEPLESTVLVILLHGASVDKRKAFYKAAQKVGEVVDSPALRDYEIPNWILSYYNARGLQIDPQAAALLAESVGTDLSTIVVETDKLTKALYFCYLRHHEGIAQKDLVDYEQEILGYYSRISGRDDQKKMRESVRNFVNPLNNSVNVSMSRIKKVFKDIVDDRIAQSYYINGRAGEPRKISLDRDLVIWEH